MKTLVVAAAIALTTTAASAQDLAYVGSVEYAFEAEAVSLDFGAAMNVGNITVNPMLNAEYTSANDLDFTGVTLGVGYALTSNVGLYGSVETDGDFDYEEATMGVSFSF